MWRWYTKKKTNVPIGLDAEGLFRQLGGECLELGCDWDARDDHERASTQNGLSLGHRAHCIMRPNANP